MRSMPTEIKKNRPDDQMTSCFLKLYTPTRVCEVIIRNWSAGQLVSSKKPDDIRRNGQKKKGNALAELARTGHRGAEVRAMMREKCTEKSRHSMPGNGHTKTRIECGANGRRKSRMTSGVTTKKGSRKDAREVHREEHGAKAPRTERRKDGT